MTIDLGAVPRRSDAVIYQLVDREAILLDLDSGYYYSLDPVGSDIWARCDGVQPLAAILDRLCAIYDVSRDQAHADLLELIGDLHREGLVVLDAGSL